MKLSTIAQQRYVAVAWGNIPNKIHLILPGGRTACGLTIPLNVESGWWRDASAMQSGHACRKCKAKADS